MKTDTAVVLGIGLLGFLWWQNRSGFAVTIAAGATGAGLAYSNGVEVPATGIPLVAAAGNVVGGGNAQTTLRPIAPELWTLGGSPSGYNAAGYQGYVGYGGGLWD